MSTHSHTHKQRRESLIEAPGLKPALTADEVGSKCGFRPRWDGKSELPYRLVRARYADWCRRNGYDPTLTF